MQANTKRILIVHQSAELYGSDRMLQQLLTTLYQNTDFNLTVHLPFHGSLVDVIQPYTHHLVIKPISILRLSLIKKMTWLNVKVFVENIRNAYKQIQQHDIIILNTCVILSYMILLPFFKKKNYIYVHELPTGLMKLIFNIMLALSGADLICNSKLTALAYPLIKKQKKYVIYNTSIFLNKNNTKIISNKINILLIGRLSYRKGHHVFLNALNLLPEALQEKIIVRIVGDMYDANSYYKETLHRIIKDQSIKSSVTFLPFDNNPSQYYDWAHIVIVPSVKPESFGLVALEAMQHGCAVIASNIGGLAEIITDNETGHLIKPDDAQALSQALQNYSDYPDLITLHGKKGHARVI